ncbi:hypothetical protein CC1G_11110 [Coprinopsis cinerea okayama7|uniref:F-box domain-containing protein n=1 Tax=Coprinopsis cinerea (strain Okayama-7 / 130 / ATCC MYA-4618 / FGSC 9003) TaxID=240176 RepID=A8P7Q3_COPC7|nr:hypothetical protein CC1G_11110 [Coprinopsis cinerea okayama7\|eukprot:XP_001839410.1 hypothetical protein CC1G_11110 [Coprinopsis cinerea okayama7\
MSQQLAPRIAPILSLPVEVFLNIISLATVTVFDVIKYTQVSRRFNDVLRGDPTLWTKVYFLISNSGQVERLLRGIDLAVSNSGSLPLGLLLEIAAVLADDQLNSILGRIVSSSSRWDNVLLDVSDSNGLFRAVSWASHLAPARSPTPFTNMQCFAINVSGAAPDHGGEGPITNVPVPSFYNLDDWNLPQLFPNLRVVVLTGLDFASGHQLPAQFAITSLEEIHLDGVFNEAPPLMVKEILARAVNLKHLNLGTCDCSTFNAPGVPTSNSTPFRHHSLQILEIDAGIHFIGNQIRTLTLPSLGTLFLGSKGKDGVYAGDFVGDFLEMIGRSGCELKYLELDCITCLSNEDMVRLFSGLPHLTWIRICITGTDIDERLFTMPLQRSTNGSILPRLEFLEVWTEGSGTFPTQSFINFVQDPRRMGGGPFAYLRAASLKFARSVAYSRP